MLFNSYEFLFIFLPITFFVYFFLNHNKLTRVSKFFLTCSSLFFYSWWNIKYLPIILVSIIFNYSLGKNLIKNNLRFPRKPLLTLGIMSNLALLGYFKYTDFFIENLNLISHSNINKLNLTLPLAISFFTFQQISYLIDSYKHEIKQYDFFNYSLFVSFFPQLIAGPIVHHKEMMPQFADRNSKYINYKNISRALFLFSIGLFKKVFIADKFAIFATAGFEASTQLSFFESWATSLSYTFQLYFDFSGYTDMATGAALLFNIKLPINFNSPYKSTNIQLFWRRWHITLSRFLKDYIYVPLGGNRKSLPVTYVNLLATFIIGGIWHGAGWTFVFWGGLHGIALIIHRIWMSTGIKLWSWLGWVITFNFVNIAWVFFRAKDWNTSIRILNSMFSLDNVVLQARFKEKLLFLTKYNITFGQMFEIQKTPFVLVWLILATLLVTLTKNSIERSEQNFNQSTFYAFFAASLFTLALFDMNKVSEFLYFNF